MIYLRPYILNYTKIYTIFHKIVILQFLSNYKKLVVNNILQISKNKYIAEEINDLMKKLHLRDLRHVSTVVKYNLSYQFL